MRPDIRRLRATWIVGLTNRYVPDAFTCHAARIKTLKRFEPYRPDLGDKDLVAVGGAVSLRRTWRRAAGSLGYRSIFLLHLFNQLDIVDCERNG